MKTFFGLLWLALYVFLIVIIMSDCSIKLIIFIATVVLTGAIGMFKEELKEKLKDKLKSK